jgi:hypothetical protein
MEDKMSETDLEDFYDPGMHGTWLVKDTEAFPLNPGPTSERDRTLNFGLNYQEWFAIFFDVLGVDKSGYDNWAKENPEAAKGSILIEFDEEIPSYPMLSRIVGGRYDIVFEADEVERLREECLRVKSQTSNAVALKGIRKLLLMCDWAQRLDLSIYLMCD